MRDWHDDQWGIVYGCTKVSAGCKNCSAEQAMARRPGYGDDYASPSWTGVVRVQPEQLKSIERCRRPLKLLVSSISDIFHKDVPDEFLDEAFDVMDRLSQHTYGLLTKRSERMREYLSRRSIPDHIWPGVSVEENDYRWRVDDLMGIEARTRWACVEPMIGPVDLSGYLSPTRLNWVAAGPELGDGARPCKAQWMRDLLAQGRAHGVPFFTKHILDEREIREYPDPVRDS